MSDFIQFDTQMVNALSGIERDFVDCAPTIADQFDAAARAAESQLEPSRFGEEQLPWFETVIEESHRRLKVELVSVLPLDAVKAWRPFFVAVTAAFRALHIPADDQEKAKFIEACRRVAAILRGETGNSQD